MTIQERIALAIEAKAEEASKYGPGWHPGRARGLREAARIAREIPDEEPDSPTNRRIDESTSGASRCPSAR